jgi:alpha-glucoside transport system substrate-binding protein
MSVVQTPVEDAPRRLFSDPPGCALYKQADFAVPWMPGGTTIRPDGEVSWFLLPGKTASKPPVLIGGDQVVQFRHTPDSDALTAYLAGSDAGRSWARRGGFLSPKSSIPETVYPTEFRSELERVLEHATTLAFDASDQMPPDIGSGLLWRDITSWVAGAKDYATLASEIDHARAADAASGSATS